MTDMTDTAEVKANPMETHSALPPDETERLTADIVAALKTVFDPEIPADIYELGLIYKVDIKDDRAVDVVMTLTTPNCPAAGELPTMVENAEGFLVATPVEIVAPDPAADKAAYEQLRTAIARTVSDDLTTALSEALRQRANPRINQANVDQIVQP